MRDDLQEEEGILFLIKYLLLLDPIHRKFVFIRSVKIHLASNVAMPGIYLSAYSKNYE